MRLNSTRKSRYQWVQKIVEVSFVTVNYNDFATTARLIESIREKVKSITYEIIVLDNASRNDDALRLYKKYPFIRIVRRLINTGLAEGYNMGVHAALGRYFYFLHNDTYFTEDHIRSLMALFDVHSDAAVVCPVVKGADCVGQEAQFAGNMPLDRYPWHYRQTKQTYEPDSSPTPIPYLNGVAFFSKREVFRDYGMLPIMYHLYFEDLDWSHTLASHGRSIYFHPACTVYHRGGEKGVEINPKKCFYLVRNSFIFAYRNYGTFNRQIHFTHLLFKALHDALMYRRQKKYELFKAVKDGVVAYFRMSRDEKLDLVRFKLSLSDGLRR